MSVEAMQREKEFLERSVRGCRATRKFREFLQETGMTQSAAAKEMGMNEEMLSRYLNGEHLPGLKRAKMISDLTEGVIDAYDWLI